MTYTYLCTHCSTEFEIQQSIKDEQKATCINCGETTTKRLITGGNFVLKGSVWARDGYHSNLREQIKTLPQAEDDD